MTLSTSLITGRLPLPDDSVVASFAKFILSGSDTEGDDVIIPKPIIIALVNGEMPSDFRLWQNQAGQRGTYYTVSAITVGDDGFGVSYPVGTIQIGTAASYAVADLLEASTIIDGTNWVHVLTTEELAVFAADRALAEAAAAI